MGPVGDFLNTKGFPSSLRNSTEQGPTFQVRTLQTAQIKASAIQVSLLKHLNLKKNTGNTYRPEKKNGWCIKNLYKTYNREHLSKTLVTINLGRVFSTLFHPKKTGTNWDAPTTRICQVLHNPHDLPVFECLKVKIHPAKGTGGKRDGVEGMGCWSSLKIGGLAWQRWPQKKCCILQNRESRIQNRESRMGLVKLGLEETFQVTDLMHQLWSLPSIPQK